MLMTFTQKKSKSTKLDQTSVILATALFIRKVPSVTSNLNRVGFLALKILECSKKA